MLMCFHWGLAVGHTYTHHSTSAEGFTATEEHSDGDNETERAGHPQEDLHSVGLSEFSLVDRKNDDWNDPHDENVFDTDYPHLYTHLL
jgi:hypothetical protein